VLIINEFFGFIISDKNQPESLRNPQRGNLPSRGTIKPGPGKSSFIFLKHLPKFIYFSDNETSKKPAEIPSSGRARNATTASSARLKSRPSSGIGLINAIQFILYESCFIISRYSKRNSVRRGS